MFIQSVRTILYYLLSITLYKECATCCCIAVGFGVLMICLTFIAAQLGGVLEVNNINLLKLKHVK